MSRGDVLNTLVRVLEKQGFAIFFGVCILGMTWHGGSWIGNEVIKPARDGYLRFMDRTATSAEKTSDGVEVLAEGVQQMGESMERMELKLDRASRALEVVGRP